MSRPIVGVRGLVKRYPGVVALNGVDIDIHAGEILGLVGKNGAGKSSLIKVLAGVERPDEGSILIDGAPLPVGYAPHLSHQLGLAFVHQELGNFSSLSVAENIALGSDYPRRLRLFISRKELRRRVSEVLEELEAEINPDAPATRLTSVQQRLVMIARALYHRARLLVLDEPSVSLTFEEIGHLHTIVRRLGERGHSVVYVSHRLNEIVSLTDRVVVMQDGRVTLTRPTDQVSEHALVDAIAGTARVDENSRPPPQAAKGGTPLLRVRGLARPPLVKDVSFDVYEGEILGLAGLVGSGRTEVARMIFGADRPTAGSIDIDGRPVRLRTPSHAVRRGIGLLPEDRRHEGLVLDFSVRENITLASLGRHTRGALPFPKRASERIAATAMVERLSITTAGVEQEARKLSGGNQQKVVLAKWLERGGRLLIFDEPAQGVDVGAKKELFALIRALADAGRAAVVISSDFSELVALCTRVVALREGRVSGVVDGAQLTDETLVRLVYTVTHETGRTPAGQG